MQRPPTTPTMAPFRVPTDFGRIKSSDSAPLFASLASPSPGIPLAGGTPFSGVSGVSSVSSVTDMLSVIHHTHADDKQAQDALPTLFDKMISSNKEVAETQLLAQNNKEVAETRVSQNKEAFVKVLSTVKDMRVK